MCHYIRLNTRCKNSFTNLDRELQFKSMARQKKSQDPKQDLEEEDLLLSTDAKNLDPEKEDDEDESPANEGNDELEMEREEAELNQNKDIIDWVQGSGQAIPDPEDLPEGMENVSWSDQGSVEKEEEEDLETGEPEKDESPKENG